MVLHLLDYIAVDYAGAVEDGKVSNADEYKEMREFASRADGLIRSLPDNPVRAALVAESAALRAGVDAKAPATQIAALAVGLRKAVIRAYDAQIAPRRAPDLARGAALYAAGCASCHGATGRGDGPAAAGLDPAPADFHDARRMARRGVDGLYSAISLGVEGTAMPASTLTNDGDLWALAFHVANFAADDRLRAQGESLWKAGSGHDVFRSLADVATRSGEEAARFGADGAAVLAYLRSAPEVLAGMGSSPIEFAVATLGRSVQAYREGRREEAAQLAVAAYLEGFELVEAGLRNLDAELMSRIEQEMLAQRAAIQAGAPVARVEALGATAIASLALARGRLENSRISGVATFAGALVILLREGAEALLVVAAILAFTARAGRRDARRWVHAGWIAAIVLGLVTWVVSSMLVSISGAHREIAEGVTAIAAAAMLLYVGYWLHSKSHSGAWQKFIGDKVNGSFSSGTIHTLALVSFLAVYREAFETVLFFQALALQAGPQGQGALVAGVAVGAALLFALGWTIVRASRTLPLGRFFSVSGIVLIVLAVVFIGQGVAALQEAGEIAIDSVGSLRLPLLGVYPTLQTLAAQAAALALGAIVLWRGSAATSPRP